MKRKIISVTLILCMIIAANSVALAADAHPYAAALRAFFADAKAQDEPRAYLADIDGDGAEEVLAMYGTDSYIMEYRIFKMRSGSLVTISPGPTDGFYIITSTGKFGVVGGEGFSNWWYICALEADKVVVKEVMSVNYDEETDDPEYYYSNNPNSNEMHKKVSKAEFDAFLKKYGFDGSERQNDAAKILAMTTGAAAPANTQNVSPTASTVYVNGAAKAFEAYNIGGNNYFKLRDLAYVLSGTAKQFEVGYDNSTKAITLTSGKPYTADGKEMVQGDGKAKPAAPTNSKIYLNGKELNLTIYLIGGNNFFKLRELMEVLDVYVGYDNATKAITLDTNKGYVK